jgi:site-specific recombinase XerD
MHDNARRSPGALGHDTWQGYYVVIQQFTQWLASRGKTPVEADEQDLVAYISFLRGDLPALDSQQSAHYAPSTVCHKVFIVRKFYASLYARDLISRNPAVHLRLPYDETKGRSPNARLSLDQVRQLLAAPRTQRPIGIRDRAVLALMALHGLSTGEAQRLDVADVDLSTGAVRVSGWHGKPRSIFLTAATRQVVEAWLSVRRLLDTGSPALFITLHWTSGRAQPGQRISTRALRQVVAGYLRAIGVTAPEANGQVLRHTYVALGLDSGATPRDLAESMGGGAALRRALSALADKTLRG